MMHGGWTCFYWLSQAKRDKEKEISISSKSLLAQVRPLPLSSAFLYLSLLPPSKQYLLRWQWASQSPIPYYEEAIGLGQKW